MKLARLALIAVLSLPSAAQAEFIKNPGPFKIPKTQFACQNLLDYQDLVGHLRLKRQDIFASEYANKSLPARENQGMLCMTVPKGTTVRVKDRWIALECVEIVGRPSKDCFYLESVSGTQRQPDPYGESHYY